MIKLLVPFILGFLLCVVLIFAVPGFADRVADIRDRTSSGEEPPVAEPAIPAGRYAGDHGWVEFDTGSVTVHDGAETTVSRYVMTPDERYLVIYDATGEDIADVWEFSYSPRFNCVVLDGIAFCR
jgi:hypothetical protein